MMSQQTMANAGAKLGIALSCGLAIAPLASTPAQASAFDGEKLYILCSRFPYNSQCEGYTAPVALEDREGEDGQCTWGVAETAQGGRCKVIFRESSLTAYIEHGRALEVLDGRPSTQEVTLDYSQVQQLQYREFKQANTGARIGNTLMFGVAGLLLTRDKPVAEVTMRYGEAGAAIAPLDASNSLDSSAAGSPEAETAEPAEQLSIVFERDKGMAMRTHLEAKTGLRIEVPAGELNIVEDSESSDNTDVSDPEL